MNALIALRLQFSSPFHHSFCLFPVSLYNSCLSTSRLVTLPLPLALGPHPLLNDLFCSEFVLRRVHIPASSWFKQLEYSHHSLSLQMESSLLRYVVFLYFSIGLTRPCLRTEPGTTPAPSTCASCTADQLDLGAPPNEGELVGQETIFV